MIRMLLGAFVALLFAVSATAVAAQTAADPRVEPVGVEGRWEGRLGASALHLLLEVTKTEDGLHFATLTSVGQGGAELSVDRMEVTGDSVRFEIRSAGASYLGALNQDRSRLIGTWTQRGRAPLEFTRAAAAASARPEANPYSLFGVAADISVPVAPVPFASAGRRHMAYEIHVRNHSGAGMLLSRVEVLDGTTSLARWEGAALHGIVRQRRPRVADHRAIPPGGWAVVYVWVTTDSAAPRPTALRHRLTVADQSLEGRVPVAASVPLVLGPPLRGGVWLAANGPGNGAGHRRALVPVNGRVFIAQRFATDWAKLGPSGQPFEGDPTSNGSYAGYGAEVFAVADGIVESVRDGIPDNVPGTGRLGAAREGDTLRAVSMTLETIAGNYVVLAAGEGRYAFYGHLMPGSVRVRRGDRVRRGEVIARVGNSGNSTAPHLHFHVSDGNQPLAAEGMPYTLDAWELMRAPDVWEPRTRELPMGNARVRFPQR
jgi:murein DD-endopeptidase MepM/ murein hydrolase activator NlpD